jgi:predicted ATP-grasp superfamily ATP-dependent carboligase
MGARDSGPPLACVIGDMDLVRPLGLAGVPVAAVTARGDAATRYSRFCRTVVDWPHPADDPDGAVAALARFAAAQERPPVLFCQGDTDLLLVSRRREALAPWFRLTVPPAAMVEDLVDKLRFAALAERLGLPTPRTWLLRRGDSLPALAREATFPAALKPVTRRKWTGFGGSAGGGIPKAARLEHAADLLALGPLLAGLETDFLLQEFVPGGEEAIASYHAYVDAAGEVAAEFTGRKLRTYPPSCGFTTALTISADAELAELGRELLRRIGYRGVVKLDFKRHATTGAIYLLELNPRFNLWHHPGAVAGVNLPYLAYCDAAGLPRPPVGPARAGVRWCWAWKDLAAWHQARSGSLLAWARFALSAETQSVFAWDDPAPFLRGVLLRQVGFRAARRRGQDGATKTPRPGSRPGTYSEEAAKR